MSEAASLVDAALAEFLKDSCTSRERLGGGTNSAVERVRTAGGRDLVVKVYPRDRRERAVNEHRALRLLHGSGLPVPEPVFLDEGRQVGAYRFEIGSPYREGEPEERDVAHAARFMAHLVEIGRRRDPGLDEVSPASDARFSVEEHRAGLEQRMQRLEACGDAAAADFVRRSVRPFVEDLARREPPGVAGPGAGTEPAAERVLSASDFGFHNAVRRPDGTVLFLDLEYFGWDDPAKTIADIFLQPDVPVPPELREGFLRIVLPVLDVAPDFLDRYRRVYPYCGLKWLLVLLNVFLRPDSAPENRGQQLGRARRMLAALEVDLATDVVPAALR